MFYREYLSGYVVFPFGKGYKDVFLFIDWRFVQSHSVPTDQGEGTKADERIYSSVNHNPIGSENDLSPVRCQIVI